MCTLFVFTTIHIVSIRCSLLNKFVQLYNCQQMPMTEFLSRKCTLVNTIKNLANFVSIRILNVCQSSPRGSKKMFKKNYSYRQSTSDSCYSMITSINKSWIMAVLRIRIRIRIHRIHLFLGLLDPDPDPLVSGMDPDHSIVKQKQ